MAAHFEVAQAASGRKEDTVVPMEPSPSAAPAPPAPRPTMGARLVNAVLNLSATAGFTLPADATETPIWAVGISTVAAVPAPSQNISENRIDLMRVVLALCSHAFYLSSEEYQHAPQPITAFITTSTPPHPAATTLLISMLKCAGLGQEPRV